MRDRPVAFFWSGDALRSRSVSDSVLSGRIDLRAPPTRLVADWARDITAGLCLAPGDVEPLSLARTRARWPDYRHGLQAMFDWARPLGLEPVLASADLALMACRGARYHHDGAQYGGAAFCNLFLSEDKGLDVHFPATGQRIPLARGTVLVFDTGQPHAVIERGATGFDPAGFGPGRDDSQVFLSWELPIENPAVAQGLGIVFDIEAATALQLDEAQLRFGGVAASVRAESGRWCRAG